ncbi:hypothetical protein KI387_004705, partial [Taxus chinensis]
KNYGYDSSCTIILLAIHITLVVTRKKATIRNGHFQFFKPNLITHDVCWVVVTSLHSRIHITHHELDNLLGLWTAVSMQPGTLFLVFQAFTLGKGKVLPPQALSSVFSELASRLRCVAAYASDLVFLETSLRPHRRDG